MDLIISSNESHHFRLSFHYSIMQRGVTGRVFFIQVSVRRNVRFNSLDITFRGRLPNSYFRGLLPVYQQRKEMKGTEQSHRFRSFFHLKRKLPLQKIDASCICLRPFLNCATKQAGDKLHLQFICSTALITPASGLSQLWNSPIKSA